MSPSILRPRRAAYPLLLTLLLLTRPPLSPAQDSDDPRIDADTGRDVSHWPHPRPFDHLHMRLELDIPDMNVPHLTGHETLTITPIGRDRDSLRLDAQRMSIHGVSIAGRPQAFTYDGQSLDILFDKPIKLGQTAEVIIDYGLQYPNNDGVGLTWTPGKPDGANDTARSPQIHTQGQPETNRLWSPATTSPTSASPPNCSSPSPTASRPAPTAASRVSTLPPTAA
jgi:hypothetical protein